MLVRSLGLQPGQRPIDMSYFNFEPKRVLLDKLYRCNLSSSSKANGFILNNFISGADVLQQMIMQGKIVVDDSSTDQQYLKDCSYAYNPETQRLVLLSYPLGWLQFAYDGRMKYAFQQIKEHLNATFNSTVRVKDVIVFEPLGNIVYSTISIIPSVKQSHFTEHEVEHEEFKPNSCKNDFNDKYSIWVNLAKTLISSQYYYNVVGSSHDFMKNLHLDRLTQLIKTTSELQRMILSIINIPEFKTPSYDAKTTALRVSLYALKTSYEKRVTEGNKYFGVFDGFFGGHSATDKLAAVTEYLETGSTSRKAAKQGLLKELIGAYEASMVSAPQLCKA